MGVLHLQIGPVFFCKHTASGSLLSRASPAPCSQECCLLTALLLLPPVLSLQGTGSSASLFFPYIPQGRHGVLPLSHRLFCCEGLLSALSVPNLPVQRSVPAGWLPPGVNAALTARPPVALPSSEPPPASPRFISNPAALSHVNQNFTSLPEIPPGPRRGSRTRQPQERGAVGSAEPLLLYTSPRKSRIGSSVFMCNSSRADSQAVYHPLEPLSAACPAAPGTSA